jgi:hypothetical protein
MLQRSGEQGDGKITFVRNNFFHDAFFLKAQGGSYSEFKLKSSIERRL